MNRRDFLVRTGLTLSAGVLAALHDRHAVDQHVDDAGRMAVRVIVRGAVGDRLPVEDDDVGRASASEGAAPDTNNARMTKAIRIGRHYGRQPESSASHPLRRQALRAGSGGPDQRFHQAVTERCLGIACRGVFHLCDRTFHPGGAVAQ